MSPKVLKATLKMLAPAVALSAAMMFLAPAAAYAQRGHGDRGPRDRGYSGDHRGYADRRDYGRAYDRDHGRGYDRDYDRGHRERYYAPPRAYAPAPYYRGGPAYHPGRFYAGLGYYYGGRFWARPYFGVGIGIPFGWGYDLGRGCGYYDGYGYWRPAPCYNDEYSPY